jgi:ribosome-associated protein
MDLARIFQHRGRIWYIFFMIRITDQLSIPEDELNFSACRSSGPGGQHVNTASTRVTLRFDLANSPSLSPHQKELLRERLPTRISKQGVLRVVSQKTRSQAANRKVALERFIKLLQQALESRPERKPVKIPAAAKKKRIADKKHRGHLKRERAWKISRED